MGNPCQLKKKRMFDYLIMFQISSLLIYLKKLFHRFQFLPLKISKINDSNNTYFQVKNIFK